MGNTQTTPQPVPLSQHWRGVVTAPGADGSVVSLCLQSGGACLTVCEEGTSWTEAPGNQGGLAAQGKPVGRGFRQTGGQGSGQD